jgi:hypothetical protein
MKSSLFSLLLLSFSFTVVAQSGDMYPEETDNQFIKDVGELLFRNLDSLKGDFINMGGKDSISVCKHMLWGFTPYIKSGSKSEAIFYGIPKTNPQPPEFNRIVGKLTHWLSTINYKIQDSETDAEIKVKAESLKLARIVSFSHLNYEKTVAERGVTLYLFPDGRYDVSIVNDVAKNQKANAPRKYVAQSKFSYDFTEAAKGWPDYSNKSSSSSFKKGKWQLVNKAANANNISNTWDHSFSTDYNGGEEPDFEVTGSFSNLSSVDTAYYGYSFTTKCKEDKMYDHVGFLYNKKNHTFSVFDFQITGDQTSNQGIKNYRAKNTKCLAPTGAAADVLGIRRYKGKILFSVNSEIVFTLPDEHPACPKSAAVNILVISKAELEVDDMFFDYAPGSESKNFKTVQH